jgi:hypothetical protein
VETAHTPPRFLGSAGRGYEPNCNAFKFPGFLILSNFTLRPEYLRLHDSSSYPARRKRFGGSSGQLKMTEMQGFGLD